MNAEIVAVGSEMLTPTHVDTNSLFITERLNELGIAVQGKAVAGDDRATLAAIVGDALRRTDLLVLSGGLGPTDDDLTRDVVDDLLGRPLEYRAGDLADLLRRGNSRELSRTRHHAQWLVVGAAAIERGTVASAWLSISRSNPSLRMRMS